MVIYKKMVIKAKKIIKTFLLWTQKWTKTDMLYVSKNSFWLTLNRSTVALLGAISVIAFANLVSEEMYGNYKYILSTLSILCISTLHGIDTAIIRSVIENCEKDFIIGLKTKIKWGVLGATASIVVGSYYIYINNYNMGLSFLIFSIFIPFAESLNMYVAFLNAKKEFKKSSKYIIISRTIVTSITITTLFITKNIFITLFMSLLSTTVLRAYFSITIIKKISKNAKHNKDNIKFGKHLSFFGIIGRIADNIDNVIMFHYLGSKSLAIYAMSTMPVLQLSGPIRSINTLAVPKITEKSSMELRKKLPSKLIKFFIILTIITLVYTLLIPYAYKIFLPKYIDAVNYSRLFSLSFLFIPAMILEQVLVSQRQKKQLYKLRIIIPLLKLSMFAIFLPLLGIIGAIITILLTLFINSLLLIIFFYKNNKLHNTA